MQNWNRQTGTFIWYLLPPVVFLICFFVIPLLIVAAFSFGERAGPVAIDITGTFQNYRDAVAPTFVVIFLKTVLIAAIVTLFCLIAGVPVAMLIAFAPPRWRPVFLLLIILPFWTNMLIRTYAMIAFLRGNGTLNSVYGFFWAQADSLAAFVGMAGLFGERFRPLELLYNDYAVVIGTAYIFLPFIILPVYATMERLDRSYLEASLDLGAGHIRTFRYVTLPLVSAGIVSGIMLVFVPALGSFLIPNLLGGPDSLLIGNIIERQFKAANHWPLGSAMSLVLIYLTFVLLVIRSIMQGRREPA